MKALIAVIVLALLTNADAQVSASVAPGRSVPYLARAGQTPHNHPLTPLLYEDFENPTGYDLAGWGEDIVPPGVVNEDYTATVLYGTQSLFMDFTEDNQTYTTNSFAATARVWVAFRFRVLSASGGPATRSVLRLMDANNTCLYRLQVNDDEQEIHGHICETGASTGNLVFSYNTTYTVWIEYNKDNGANSYTSLAMATSGTRPTSGPDFVDVTSTQNTLNPSRIMIGSGSDQVGFNIEYIVDHLLVDDVQINDWP